MAFAAPLVEGVAGSAAASAAGAGAAEGAGAGAARAGAGAGAAGARGSSRTAASRADQLHGSRAPRYKARRALADEYGATAGQADDLLDAAASRAPAQPADAEPRSSAPAQRGGAVGGGLGRSIGNGVNASGGFVLGALGYVLFLVYLRGGTPAVKSWLRAKFLNRVDGATPLPATTYQSTSPTVAATLRVAPGGGAPALTTPPTPSTTSTARTWNA